MFDAFCGLYFHLLTDTNLVMRPGHGGVFVSLVGVGRGAPRDAA